MVEKIYDMKNTLLGIKWDGYYISADENHPKYALFLKEEKNLEVTDNRHSEEEELSSLREELLLLEKRKVAAGFLAGFDHDTHHFGLKEHDQRNYLSACLGVRSGMITSDTVQTESNGTYLIDTGNVEAFYKASVDAKNKIVDAYETKKEAINNCTSVAELEALGT